ncbi:hypothetical protein ACSBR1_028743 [Camellia fascicularis]
MYMFSLGGGMGVDCGQHSHAFQLKLPFWTPNVQFYYCKEPPMLNHDQYYNDRGTLALPVFETSRQSYVGVLELIMTSQKISYAPKDLVGWFNISLNFFFFKNGVFLICTVVFAVSESTLKRKCWKIDISKWPSHKRNKVKPVDESVPSAGANDPTLSTSPSLLPTVVVLDQPKPLGSELQREKSKSLCFTTEVGFGQFERLLDHMPGGYDNELRVQSGILQEFGKMTPKGNLFIGVTNEQCPKVEGSSELVFQLTRPNPSIAHCNPDAILSTLPQTP